MDSFEEHRSVLYSNDLNLITNISHGGGGGGASSIFQEEWKTVKSKGRGTKKYSSAKSETEATSSSLETTDNDSNFIDEAPSTTAATTTPADVVVVTNEAGQPLATDPVKRLRNLRKKLKEIESLKLRNVDELEKEQIDKLNREDEIIEQVESLARLIGEL